jgi:hypothetical protein
MWYFCQAISGRDRCVSNPFLISCITAEYKIQPDLHATQINYSTIQPVNGCPISAPL